MSAAALPCLFWVGDTEKTDEKKRGPAAPFQWTKKNPTSVARKPRW